jgi:chromosome segregation ATPase
MTGPDARLWRTPHPACPTQHYEHPPHPMPRPGTLTLHCDGLGPTDEALRMVEAATAEQFPTTMTPNQLRRAWRREQARTEVVAQRLATAKQIMDVLQRKGAKAESDLGRWRHYFGDADPADVLAELTELREARAELLREAEQRRAELEAMHRSRRASQRRFPRGWGDR